MASARREEVEAQQRESEREVRALREAAALAESSFAEWLESMRASGAAASFVRRRARCRLRRLLGSTFSGSAGSLSQVRTPRCLGPTPPECLAH